MTKSNFENSVMTSLMFQHRKMPPN